MSGTDEPPTSRRPIIREEGFSVPLNGKVLAVVMVALVGGGASGGALNFVGGGQTAKAVEQLGSNVDKLGEKLDALGGQFVEWRAQAAARDEIYRSRISAHDEALKALGERVQRLEERGRPR